jgi:hypothetical protein
MNEEPGAEQIRFPLLVTLWFGRHLDRTTLRDFLEHSRAEHAERLALYDSITSANPLDDAGRRAVVQFGIAYERALVDWLDQQLDETG